MLTTVTAVETSIGEAANIDGTLQSRVGIVEADIDEFLASLDNSFDQSGSFNKFVEGFPNIFASNDRNSEVGQELFTSNGQLGTLDQRVQTSSTTTQAASANSIVVPSNDHDYIRAVDFTTHDRDLNNNIDLADRIFSKSDLLFPKHSLSPLSIQHSLNVGDQATISPTETPTMDASKASTPNLFGNDDEYLANLDAMIEFPFSDSLMDSELLELFPDTLL